jgi:predicted ArsR family transcriptional regulator
MPTPSKDSQVLEALQQASDLTIEELADQTGLSTKTVRKHIRMLLEHGYVGIVEDWPRKYFALPT